MVERIRRRSAQLKEAGLLALTRRRLADTSNLRKRSSIELSEFFSSKAIEENWQEEASELRRFEIPGSAHGVNPGDRRAIYYLVKYLLPGSVLEVGTHIGASLVHIVLAMAGTGHVVAVDIEDVNSPRAKPWLKYGSKHSPREMIESLGYQDTVLFVAGKSLDYMRDTRDRFDFIFLDGDHHARTVYKEIPLALRILNPNGVILLHDYFPDLKPLWPDGPTPIRGPYLATERLRMEGAAFRVVPLGDLPWPTKKGTNRTSLALLVKA